MTVLVLNRFRTPDEHRAVRRRIDDRRMIEIRAELRACEARIDGHLEAYRAAAEAGYVSTRDYVERPCDTSPEVAA